MPRNPNLRVPPDAQFVQWLSRLGSEFHVLLGVVGTDFSSDCIVVKPRGIFNVHVDTGVYRLIRRDGEWVLPDDRAVPNPRTSLETQTSKIREFMIQVKEKVLPNVEPSILKDYAGQWQVFPVVALTRAFVEGTPPKAQGTIRCSQPQLLSFLHAQAFLRVIPKSMNFDAHAARRLANLLGLEPMPTEELVRLTPGTAPITKNPYHFTSEVGPDQFRGRAEEIALAMNCLSQEPSTPVALVGLQRTGKSSLAGEIIRRLTLGEKKTRVISYVLGNYDPQAEYADVSGFLLKNIPDPHNIEGLIAQVPHLKKTPGLLRELFRDALRQLKKTTGTGTIVCLDELHKLDEKAPGSSHPSFPDFLETLAKDKTLGLKLIVSARPIMLTETEGVKRANLLKLFRPIRVASVDRDAAIQIINLGQPNLVFEQEAIDRILRLSGKNAYWIQLLCYETFMRLHLHGARGPHRVTRGVIDNAFSSILRSPASRAYFEAFYQDVVPLGSPMRLLNEAARLASAQGATISCEELGRACGFGADVFNLSLKPLLDYEILLRDIEGDPVRVSFVSEGLRQYLRLERNLPLGPGA
jgi:hypothetical protein